MVEWGFEDLDVELFIAEVEKYPEIWNATSEEYHNRTRKKQAWTGIARVFCDTFDDCKERDKDEIRNKLIKRWRNIKDNFFKSLRKRSRSNNPDTGRSYIYSKQLWFLEHAMNLDPMSNIKAEIELEDAERSMEGLQTDSVSENSYQNYFHNAGSSGKRKREIEVMNYTGGNLVPSHYFVSEPNPDRAFFESLVPCLSDFSEDQKLEFRCEVLKLVQKMRKSWQNDDGKKSETDQ